MKITKVNKHGNQRWRVSISVRGRQHRAFFKTEEEAVDYADHKQNEQRKLGEVWMDLKAADRARAVAAIERARAGGYDLFAALDYFEDHRKHNGMVKVEDAVVEVLASKRSQGVSKRYYNELQYTLSKFKASFKNRAVCSVRPKEIEAWLNSNGWSATTRKGYRVDVQTLYSYCMAHDYVVKNPVKSVPVPIIDYKPPGILSVSQARKLMDAASDVDQGICGHLALGMFAGIRPSELARLSSAQVDLEGKICEITQGKNRRARRLVQLSENCVAWCRVGLELPVSNVQERMAKVRGEAGIVDWPHDCMRHSYCTYALPILGSAATALNAGHSEAILFKHYAERVKKSVAEAFFGINPEK